MKDQNKTVIDDGYYWAYLKEDFLKKPQIIEVEGNYVSLFGLDWVYNTDDIEILKRVENYDF